jgi:hypothetical protein
MPRCEWCGATLPTRTGAGRPRRFCGATCRKAANREQAGWVASTRATGDPVDDAALERAVEAVAGELPGVSTSPVDRLAQLIAESEGLSVAYVRVSKSVPRPLAARAGGMAEHIRAGLARYFPREDRA